jgi:carbonic anhydrase
MSQDRYEINISKKNIYGKCDSKCIYNFRYEVNNSLVAKNNGVNISLTPDKSNQATVVYNDAEYDVHKIDLYCPSLHIFDGKKLDAEIVVTHTAKLGGPHLLVCVPIKSSSDLTSASDLITQVISDVASNAPSKDETTTLSISDFTLEEIIPTKSPFMAYSGAFSQTQSNYVVYGKVSTIPLSQSTLDTLKSIIKPFPLKMFGGNIFVNEKGANSQFSSKGIYISCKPTGSSNDEEIITTTNSSSSSSSSFFRSPMLRQAVKFFMIFIIFMILFVGLNFAFTKFSTK